MTSLKWILKVLMTPLLVAMAPLLLTIGSLLIAIGYAIDLGNRWYWRYRRYRAWRSALRIAKARKRVMYEFGKDTDEETLHRVMAAIDKAVENVR